jgi:hypothetical protein
MPLSVIKEELDGKHENATDLDARARSPRKRRHRALAPSHLFLDDEETISKLHPIDRMPELTGAARELRAPASPRPA